MPEFAVTPAGVGDFPAALEVLFLQLPDAERAVAVERTRVALRDGLVKPEDLRLAKEAGRIVGVMLASLAPGAAGLLSPPQAARHAVPRQIEDALIQSALSQLRHGGAKIAQALLPPEEQSRGASLLRNGFQQITTLWYLRHSLDSVTRGPVSPQVLRYVPFSDNARELFRQTLKLTYEGTADCPELNGVLTVDEILAGHRAQGKFAPERWRLAFHNDAPVGVLLVNELAEPKCFEIIYMGVIPAARGRGLGRQLVLHALQEARRERAASLTISVDGRNSFARRLYDQLGFVPWDQRLVFLAILDSP